MSTFRPAVLLALLPGIAASSLLASCQATAPPVSGPPSASGSPPVLQSVAIRRNVRAANGAMVSAVPDFYFSDADGDVVMIKRELLETSGAESRMNVPGSSPVEITAAIQKKQAVYSGAGWHCGTGRYFVKLRAQLLDAGGHQSNWMEYTVHCNGG